MALMERIATLLRANVNDLIERAEDPEKLLRQFALDMENQLLQLKTQVAMTLANQHLLEGKLRDGEATAADWQRRAELAVNKGDDELARAALERLLAQERSLASFRMQVAEQAAESDSLRSTYLRLQGKLAETQGQCELLLARHRQAQVVQRATETRAALEEATSGSQQPQAIRRLQSRVDTVQAQTAAAKEMLPGQAGVNTDSLENRFTSLEREDRVEQRLAELKGKQNRMLAAG